MRLGFAISALVCLGASAFPDSRAHAAAAPLTLDQAVHEAEERSPKVAQAQAAADAASWGKKEALSGFLPRVDVAANHIFGVRYQNLQLPPSMGGGVFDFIFPTTQVTFEASMPIFDGFANVSRYGAASAESDAASKEAEWAIFQTAQDVRLKFYQAVGARELAAVAAQNLKTLQDHMDKIQAIRRGGAATNFDVLRVSAQLSEAVSEKLQAEDNVALARDRLAEAMGEREDDRTVEGDLPRPDAKVLQLLPAPKPELRPDLAAAVDRERAADKGAYAASVFWMPRFSLGANYQYYDNRTPSQFLTAYQVGIFLNWTLFDIGEISRSSQASYREIQAQKATEAAILHQPTDFDFWKRRYQYSSALYAAKVEDVAKAQESVRLASEGFKAGVRTNSDILDAELDLFRARAGVVTSQLGALEALINLELAIGKKL